MRSLPVAWLGVVDLKGRASETACVWHRGGVGSPLVTSVSCRAGDALDRRAGVKIDRVRMDAPV